MATLNEMIAQGAQFNIPDPVAQYNKLAQMQQYKTQNELSQQEAIDKATERQRVVSDRTRRATFLTGLSAKLAEKGYTLDRSTLASMLSSGIPDIEKLALEGFKALSADEAYNAAMAKPAPAPAPTGGAPAPMAAAVADAPISTANDYVTGVVAPGIPIARSTARATTFNPATGDFELVPDKDQVLARGEFKTLTKTYSPYNSTVVLSPYEQLNKLNNILADLTNGTNLTPQNEIKIQNIKDEINRLTTTNAMVPQAAPAPAAAPTAAPPSELQVLRDQRNQLQRIRPQTPDDVARLNNTLNGIDKQIEVLNRQDPDAVRIARAIAATVAPPGTAKNLAAYNKALREQTDKSKENIIGVAKGTGNPVYLDSISDEQYIYVADADGKQKRKLYSGPVDRSTSNVSATANARLPPLESAERKGKGELNVSLYKVISDAARLATKTLPALETQAKILDSGFKTGFGTETQKAAASLLSALGVPEATKFATDAQTFLAATQQAVLQKQLEQKGPQTESDAKRITDTGAQLGNTVEANRFIVDVAKAQFKRDLNQRGFFDKWWAKNETYEGAEDAWFNGEGGKSLFDAPELTKYVASKRSEADAILKGK